MTFTIKINGQVVGVASMPGKAVMFARKARNASGTWHNIQLDGKS